MKRKGAALLAAAFVLLFSGVSWSAQWANPDLLISADSLKNNIGKADWIVVDCRPLNDYVVGHIPGAISLGDRCLKVLRDGTYRAFKDVSKYEKMFGKVGIGNNTHVVFYGDMKGSTMYDSTVGFWILEYLGHDKVHVLNGGLTAWVQGGNKLDTQPTIKQAATFKAKVIPSRYASSDEVLKIAKGQAKGTQLIDARTKAEYDGYAIKAVRGGHIPNVTANIDFFQTYDQTKDPATGKESPNGFLSPNRIADFYKSMDKNKRTVGYCQTGTRSTTTYLQLRLLGFKDPANYDDSWVVWGNNAKYPIEDEQFHDFSSVSNLQADVAKLQNELNAIKKKLEGSK